MWSRRADASLENLHDEELASDGHDEEMPSEDEWGDGDRLIGAESPGPLPLYQIDAHDLS